MRVCYKHTWCASVDATGCVDNDFCDEYKPGREATLLWEDTLHGGCVAEADSRMHAWMLIRNWCYDRGLAIPTLDKIKKIGVAETCEEATERLVRKGYDVQKETEEFKSRLGELLEKRNDTQATDNK